MADPNKFPWRVADNDAEIEEFGIKSNSGWADIRDADGLTIGSIYMLSRADNVAWAQKIVDLVNADAIARDPDFLEVSDA